MADQWGTICRSAAVVLLLHAAACSAGTSIPPSTRAVSATPAFIALSVADLDATVAWYRGTFAMPVIHRLPIPDSLGAGAVLESAELRVELVRLRAASPQTRAPNTAHLTHGIFKAGFSVRSLAPYLARFSERRVTIVAGPFTDTLTRTRSVIVADNEQNLVHLFEGLPR
jgi:catechol 2,3-dioxygenase-like lactoylglutathione lyase family enzyme